MKDISKKLCGFFIRCYFFIAFLILPSMAFASTPFGDDGNSTTIDTVLQHLIGYLTSAPARALAVVAIIGIGYSTWHLGKIPKEKAMAIIIGIGIVFGATTLAKMLGVGT